MIRAGLFRSTANFAREAKSVSVRDIPRRDMEALIHSYLTKHPGQYFASEIAEALGQEFRSVLETVRGMIEKGRVTRSKRLWDDVLTDEGDGIIGKRTIYLT